MAATRKLQKAQPWREPQTTPVVGVREPEAVYQPPVEEPIAPPEPVAPTAPDLEAAQPVVEVREDPRPKERAIEDVPARVPDADELVMNELDAPRSAIRVVGSRVEFSLGSVGCMVVAASFCVALLAAYSTGRRSAASGEQGRDVAALAKAASNPMIQGAAVDATPQRTQVEQRVGDVDLSRLMQAPSAKIEKPSEPVRPPAAAVAKEQPGAKPLHFLHIESFRYGSAAGRADVAAELQDVRKFLKSRGVETVCRDTGKEFVLLGAAGVAGIKEADAVQFKTRIEQYGREYRKAGGRYEFKGCFWRSESTLPGRPVDTRQE